MYKYIKRIFDIILSLIFLALLWPLMIITYLILKKSLGGKIWYPSIRFGLNQAVFKMYKFKTLNGDFSIPHEERMTKVSKTIRLLGFDELPQLFNILIGNMSFIGPRPFLVIDRSTLPENALDPKRYTVKPGVFGHAQSKGRRKITHDEKIKWDLKYVDEISFWTDFKLFWLTIFAIVGQYDDIFRDIRKPKIEKSENKQNTIN